MTVSLKNTAVKIFTLAFCRMLVWNMLICCFSSIRIKKNPKNPKFSQCQKCLMRGTLCKMKIGFVILTRNSSNLFTLHTEGSRKVGEETQPRFWMNSEKEALIPTHPILPVISQSVIQVLCQVLIRLPLRPAGNSSRIYHLYEKKFCSTF